MRALGEDDPFLVTATRLGGRHGYDAAGASSVMGGAVTGFSKALAREREHTTIKAVDFAPSGKTAALADILIEETLRDPGAVEIGHADDLRWTVGLVERPAQAEPERGLPAGATVVVTGAAGSIVSAITADLATSTRAATFHLLDLVPEPDRDDPDLERFTTDRDGLKRDIVDRLKQAGERPTPKLVERDLARIERARAARDSMSAIERASGTAVWHQVDLTDAEQVAAVLAPLRANGHVDLLLHCAGLEISHFLPDKPQREFDLVFDVKVNGWFHLLAALRGVNVDVAVAFSSIAGRFGNGGQTDYSAASDLLCKSVSHLRCHGATRGIAIDWTAWAQIGMATRGSIPKMMEMAGIEMLPPAIGVPWVRHEVASAGDGGEVVVAGSLGILGAERHPTGGLDADAATERLAASHGPMTGKLTALTIGEGLRVQTMLDPRRQSFLDHHRIDGTPVLPGVMGIEGFVEAAHAMLPGWTVATIEDIDLRAPFKFYRDEPRTLELRALLRDGGDGMLQADCRLVGRRELPGNGEQETVHFTGRVHLTREAPDTPRSEAPPAESDADAVDHDALYRVYFHGPAYQVLDRAYRHDGELVGRFADDLPPDHDPVEQPTEAAPRLVELCFQTAGVLELGTEGRMGLPTHVDRVSIFPGWSERGPFYAVVRPNGVDAIDAEVVDEEGRVRVRLEGYRTVALPGELDSDALAPIRAAIDATESG
jgi:NAD(P)-dependent dehydrogenase (short-subunit alcohol dehydrogenase family)